MKKLVLALIFLIIVMIPTNGLTRINPVEEKLSQFIGRQLLAVQYDEESGVLYMDFDQDNDPETTNADTLRITDIVLDDIRVNPVPREP